MKMRLLGLVVMVAAILALTLGTGAHADDATMPNDPGFAPCENQSPVTGCKNNEQWNLFGPLTAPCPDMQPRPDGGLPCWAPLAHDPQHASGVNMTGAWAQGNVGRPDILVAYIEGGVNYDSDGIKDGLDHIYLNRGELPYPERADGTTLVSGDRYDLNGDGRVSISDYAQDPRVNPPCPAGVAPFVYRGASLDHKSSQVRPSGGARSGSGTTGRCRSMPRLTSNRRSSPLSPKKRMANADADRTAPSTPPRPCERKTGSSRRNRRRSLCKL